MLDTFKDKATAQAHLDQYQYKGNAPAILMQKSFEDLIRAAQIESDGVNYNEYVYKPAETIISSYSSSSGGDDDKIELPERTEAEVKNSYKGSKDRYNEICEVIAQKLIHDPTLEKSRRFGAFASVVDEINPNSDILKKVEDILIDKLAESQKTVLELGERFPIADPKRDTLVKPLYEALVALQGEGRDSAADKLYAYKEVLTKGRSNGQPSILAELKESADIGVLRIIKNILSVITRGFFSTDSEFSKKTDQMLGLSQSQPYQSLSHAATKSTSQATVEPQQQKPDAEQTTGPKV